MSHPQLAQLTAFLAVAEHLSFRKAAVQVGIAAPTMSQTIRSFEDRLADSDEAGHAFQFEAGRGFRSEAGHPWRRSHGSIS
jgi:hypothetical protein